MKILSGITAKYRVNHCNSKNKHKLWFLMWTFPQHKAVFYLSYLSRASGGRTELWCPLVWAEQLLRYRRLRTGRWPHHICSPRAMRCRCSCCCCLTAQWCSCGCCQRCASTPAESYRRSRRAWHPTGNRHLGEEETKRGWLCLELYFFLFIFLKISICRMILNCHLFDTKLKSVHKLYINHYVFCQLHLYLLQD